MELLRRLVGPAPLGDPPPTRSATSGVLGPLGFRHDGLDWVVVVKEGRNGKPMIHTPTAQYPLPPGTKDRATLRKQVEQAFARQYISDAYPSAGDKKVPGFRGYPAHQSLLASRALLRELPFVQPTHGFASEREAVLAYGQYLVKLSKRSDVEFGAELARTSDGRYRWGRTLAGDQSSVAVDFSIERSPRGGLVTTHMHLHDVVPSGYEGRQAFSTADLSSMMTLLPRADGSTVIYNVDSRTGDVLRMTLDAKGREAVKEALAKQASLGIRAKDLLCEGHLRIELVADKPGAAPHLPLGLYHDSADVSGYVLPVPYDSFCQP